MIVLIGNDGKEDVIEFKNLRKGDLFYTIDAGNKGPVMQVEEDASLRIDPKLRQPVWSCRTKFIGILH